MSWVYVLVIFEEDQQSMRDHSAGLIHLRLCAHDCKEQPSILVRVFQQERYTVVRVNFSDNRDRILWCALLLCAKEIAIL